MRLPIRFAAAALCGAACLILVPGCEDSAAKERDNVQATLSKIGTDLQSALAGVSGDEAGVKQAQAKLGEVVNRLSAVNGGGDGQQAAKSLMAATALQQLACLQAAEADAMESDHANQRLEIGTQIDNLLSLQALASGVESASDTSHASASLKKELDDAEKRAQDLASQLAKLQSDIAERDEPNAAGAEQVNKLRQQVAELRRKAQEMGVSDGFETFRRAIDTSRQADKIDNEVGHRQAELEYSLRPEHKYAGTQASQVQEMIKSIQGTQGTLQAMHQALTGDVSATKQKIDSLTQEVVTGLGKIDGDNAGPLSAAYDGALASLDKAASQARNAASKSQGDDSQGAKLMTARILEQQGRLHAQRAHAASSQASLLGALAQVDPKFADQAKAASAASDASIQKAKEAYTGAQELASQIQLRGNPAATDAFNQGLQTAIASLSGKEAAAPVSSTPTAAPSGDDLALTLPTAGGGASAEVPAMGFATPEEAIAYASSLNNGDDSMQTRVDKLAQCTLTKTPTAKAAMDMTREMAADSQPLYDAMVAKFGAEATKAAFKKSSMGGRDLSGVKPTLVDDSHATYQVTLNGMAIPGYLVKINGKWYFDGDQIDPFSQQMLAMKNVILPIAKKVNNETAQAIRDGKYATADEAIAGLMAASQQAAAAAMQGGAGAPGK